MATFEISISAISVKVEVANHNRISVDLTFESKGDFMHEVREDIDPTAYFQHLGENECAINLFAAFGDHNELWACLEEKGGRLTLESVSDQVNEIDSLADEITDLLGFDASDEDDVKSSVSKIEKKMERIATLLKDLRP